MDFPMRQVSEADLLRAEEEAAANGSGIVRIGHHLKAISGYSSEELVTTFWGQQSARDKFSKRGMFRLEMVPHGSNEKIVAYCLRGKNEATFGTREDFTEVGMAWACDRLDAKIAEEGSETCPLN